MKNKLLPIIIVVALLAAIAFYVRPYNSAEFNAATIYYQSYSQLYSGVSQYVESLEKYDASKDLVYLEKASVELDKIRDNLQIFKLASLTNYRDTVINQRVVKPAIFSLQTLNDIAVCYENSQVILQRYIETKAPNTAEFKRFIDSHKLMLTGLKAERIGYDEHKKEFSVVIDNDNTAQLQKGIYDLMQMSE